MDGQLIDIYTQVFSLSFWWLSELGCCTYDDWSLAGVNRGPRPSYAEWSKGNDGKRSSLYFLCVWSSLLGFVLSRVFFSGVGKKGCTFFDPVYLSSISWSRYSLRTTVLVMRRTSWIRKFVLGTSPMVHGGGSYRKYGHERGLTRVRTVEPN